MTSVQGKVTILLALESDGVLVLESDGVLVLESDGVLVLESDGVLALESDGVLVLESDGGWEGRIVYLLQGSCWTCGPSPQCEDITATSR